MTDIKQNLEVIAGKIETAANKCQRSTKEIILIAVSKRKSVQAIEAAIQAGAKHFGENYIQEAVEKINIIGKEKVCWHFIGHLQSNKAKFAVNYFEYIHTVDSVKLARQIDKQAAKISKLQKILLQVNIGLEKSKSGSSPDQVLELARQVSQFENVSVQGLMGMPPYLEAPDQVRPYFAQMMQIKQQIEQCRIPNVHMNHLSMGMSNDFEVAIEEGSTMVRVGTSIFGRRD